MSKRDEKQDEMAAHILLKKWTILFVSIRLGKTRVALKAIEEGDKVLVVYPLASIKKSWLDELKKFVPKSLDITFTTHKSLHKYLDGGYTYVILDEPQLMQSAKNLAHIAKLKPKKKVGLTGTLNKKTINKLNLYLNLRVGLKYHISDAIKDKLVKDYRVYIHYVDLDNELAYVDYTDYSLKYPKEMKATEKVAYNYYTERMDYFKTKLAHALEEEDYKEAGMAKGGYNKYMGLRTNLLYNSVSLLDSVKSYLSSQSLDKVLVYSLRTDIADQLATQSYHSKKKDEKILEQFKEAKTGALAAVNSIQAGVTIQHLSNIVFHSYESNTEVFYQKLGRSLLYEFDTDLSQIDIFCLRDTQMESWVDEACTSLEQEKIYLQTPGGFLPKLEFIKLKYPDKKLFLYEGKIVYFVKDFIEKQLDGSIKITPIYSFLGSPDKTYPIKQSNLKEL